MKNDPLKKDPLLVKFENGNLSFYEKTLPEAFYELTYIIKKTRADQFLIEFSEFLKTFIGDQETLSKINNYDFLDLLDSVIRRVVNNKSEVKKERFKKILKNQILNPRKSDLTETYLDIIEKINETQIKILKCHLEIKYSDYDNLTTMINSNKKYEKELESLLKKELKLNEAGAANSHNVVKKDLTDIKQKRTERENKLRIINYKRYSSYYKISDADYFFYVQDLISKSLLYDTGIGRYGYQPFNILSITSFGERFLNFIKK